MHIFQGFIAVAMLLLAVNAGGSYTEQNLDSCQVSYINMCDYISCHNNGTCERSNNSDCYKCNCPPGFGGKVCLDVVVENETDCSSSPCLNGGSCFMTGLGTFFCYCSTGFFGQHCEIKAESPNTTDICSPNPCMNNGQCIDLGEKAACLCPGNTTGQFCENNTNQTNLCDAFQQFCLNGGSCAMRNGTAQCVCSPDYTGYYCQTKQNTTDSCSSSPCLNGGLCYDYKGHAMCVCSRRSSGRYCEYGSFDPCDSAPCMNNGTCISQNQTYTCACPPGITGDQCQTRIQLTCEDNPCYNGGTCYQGKDSFVCMCPNQYEGEQCDIMNVIEQCPLDCFPGDCVRTNISQYPYVCSCRGTIHLDSCEEI